MLVNPAVYQKIQAEVDRVVGSHRLPEFYDQKDLPYLRAAIVETERWRSIQPLGVPHRCTEETEYRGMRIPKGAFMFPNHASVLLSQRPSDGRLTPKQGHEHRPGPLPRA